MTGEQYECFRTYCQANSCGMTGCALCPSTLGEAVEMENYPCVKLGAIPIDLSVPFEEITDDTTKAGILSMPSDEFKVTPKFPAD